MVFRKFTEGDIFRPGDQILQSISIFGNIFRNSIGHILLIERIFATLMSKKYEHYKWPYFGAIWLPILLIFCLFNVLTNGQSWTSTTLNFASNSFLQICTFMEVLVIFVIGVQNGKKYVRIMPNTERYSLSEKYQISENIRTSRQLAPAFLFHFLNNLLYAGLNSIIYFKIFVQQPAWQSLSYALILMLTAIFEALIEITVVTHHPLLRRRFGQYLMRIFSFNFFGRDSRIHELNKTISNGNEAINGIEKINSPMNINGTPLIRIESADGHFRMLAHIWN